MSRTLNDLQNIYNNSGSYRRLLREVWEHSYTWQKWLFLLMFSGFIFLCIYAAIEQIRYPLMLLAIALYEFVIIIFVSVIKESTFNRTYLFVNDGDNRSARYMTFSNAVTQNRSISISQIQNELPVLDDEISLLETGRPITKIVVTTSISIFVALVVALLKSKNNLELIALFLMGAFVVFLLVFLASYGLRSKLEKAKELRLFLSSYLSEHR